MHLVLWQYVNSDVQPHTLPSFGVPKEDIVSYQVPIRHEDFASTLSDRSGSLKFIGRSLDMGGSQGLIMLQDSAVNNAMQVQLSSELVLSTGLLHTALSKTVDLISACRANVFAEPDCCF